MKRYLIGLIVKLLKERRNLKKERRAIQETKKWLESELESLALQGSWYSNMEREKCEECKKRKSDSNNEKVVDFIEKMVNVVGKLENNID
jgi:hypothetical protein